MAIEQARREAKRRAKGQSVEEPSRPSARTVKGLSLIVWLILLSVASVALGLVLYFTPLMSARSLDVIGTGVVTREEVVNAAQVRLGTPLLQIDTGAVATGWPPFGGSPVPVFSANTLPRCGSRSPSGSPSWSRTFRTARTCSTGTVLISRPARRRPGCRSSTSTAPVRPTRPPGPHWR